ncbi:MAG: DUF421 domain-containing protein [Acutalibacteraceae bacterium]|nr:DUF421 domain-containing protein [Acutalibacteraceae bacterium]
MFISAVRSALIYVFIIAAMRIMGKRQISDMQTSELVITLIISDIAAIPLQNTSQPLLSGIIPILVLMSMEIIFSVIMLKKSKFRKLICGSPVLLIEDGKLLESQMKRLRISTEDLCAQLRQLNIFSLNEVQYCIAETNGSISVLQKPPYRTPNCAQSKIKTKDDGIEAVVINDGEILSNSLKLCGMNEEILVKRLSELKLRKEDIFILTADKKKITSIILKESKNI